MSSLAIAGLIASQVAAAPPSVEAAFPGYNGSLLITRGHTSYEGRTRSNISLTPQGTELFEYTSIYAATGLVNTQKLYHTFDGTGFVGSKGYADLTSDTWHLWPSLPLTIEFDFTACPDGRFYYLYSMKFDGTDLRQVAEVAPHGISCSPDGSKISFVDWPTEAVYGNDLYIINTDGTGLVQLTVGQRLHIDGASPSWSPDGQKIAYTKDAGSPVNTALAGVWTIDVASKVESRIFTTGTIINRPVYSPDGTTITFYDSMSITDNSGKGTWLINADGTNLRSFAIQSEPYSGGYAFVT
jgi:hypothetical protein